MSRRNFILKALLVPGALAAVLTACEGDGGRTDVAPTSSPSPSAAGPVAAAAAAVATTTPLAVSTLDPTVECATVPAATPGEAICDATKPAAHTLLPIQGYEHGTVHIDGAHLAGKTVYVALNVQSCLKECSTLTGVFRTDGTSGWHKVADDSRVVLAASNDRFYWTASTPAPEIHSVKPVTLADSPVAANPLGGHFLGLAAADRSLYSLLTTADFASTTLERRDYDGDGRLQKAASLVTIQGGAGSLRTNGHGLAWAEAKGFAIADISGKRRDLVALPTGSEIRGIGMVDTHVVAAFEAMQNTTGSVCAYDLATGKPRVVVAEPPGVTVCSVAANSTHVFWTQAAHPNQGCTQVWSKPLAGGAASVVSCGGDDTDFLDQTLLANDEGVYWIRGATLYRAGGAS